MKTDTTGKEECIELTVRDELALDRTVLANDRTFLAYMRTSLALLAAAMTLITFFGHAWMIAIGWSFVPLSIVTCVVGIKRYREMRTILNLTREGRPPYSDLYPTYSKRSAHRN